MDKKTAILLQRYTDNPRITGSELSSELKLSKNAVLERIKHLKEKKVILGSTCFLNYFKLGYSQYLFFIKSSSFYQKKDFLKELKLDCVLEILSLYGKYNLYIKFISLNEEHKQKFIEHVLETLDVEDYEIVTITQYDLKPAKKYLSEHKSIPINYFPSNFNEKEFVYDKLDLQFLKELTKNSEQSLVSISQKLNTTAQVLTYRLRRLINENIIIQLYGITEIFNSEIQLYFLRFELTKPTQSKKLFRQLIADENIQDISLLEHKSNFFCVLEANSRQQTIKFIQNLLKVNSNIKSIELDVFSDQVYYNLFPKILESKNN